jgi:hypothetical protein
LACRLAIFAHIQINHRWQSEVSYHVKQKIV